MALPIPNLDDRSFNDLLQEAKSLIPIYNKDWTNHNPSDPGITLLEMFAWLSEMIIYRLNQVPEANYRAFLELLGIEYIFRWDEVWAEVGAHGKDNNRLLKFLSENYGITWLQPVTIAKGPDGQTISITDGKNNILLGLNRERNKVIANFHTGKNAEFEAKPEYLFSWGDIPGIDNSKLLKFTNEIFEMPLNASVGKNADGSVISVTTDADVGKYVTLTLNPGQDYVKLTAYTGRDLQLAVVKEKDQLKVAWLKIYLPIDQDIKRGLAFLNQRYRAITTTDFEELTLECMCQLQPDLTGRVIGMMNRDLEYSKSNPDTEKPGHVTVMLLVSGEKPVCCWDDIPGPDDIKLKDFLARLYNINWLSTSRITKEADTIEVKKEDDTGIKILLKKTGDSEVELNCPGYVPDKLVIRKETLNGAEKSYLYAYGVGDAIPSVLLRRQVKQFLSQRKLVTTRVHVVPPDYYPLKLDIRIVLSPNANSSSVIELAKTTVKRYFSPLEGGESGNGWPLGRYVYRSEIYQLLEGVSGVDHVDSLILYEKDPANPGQLRPLAAPNDNQVAIQPWQLIDPNINITITEVFP